MPFNRIGGSILHTPIVFAQVQTDGSYRGIARVAAVVLGADGQTQRSGLCAIHARNSTKTEWASVAYGLRLAIKHKEFAVALENDNLGVVTALMYPKKQLKHDYARHYRYEIQTLTKETAWTGIRWIPRELNRADDLFH